jgi:DNA-binding transcriptional ArsR family regulator
VASETSQETTRYADMLAAMGAEARLRVVRLLLTAHPKGMAAGDISAELGINASTLSHHLDRLKREDVVTVRREGTFLWYQADPAALEQLIGFLFAECCTRTSAIAPERLIHVERGLRKP